MYRCGRAVAATHILDNFKAGVVEIGEIIKSKLDFVGIQPKNAASVFSKRSSSQR